jgi:hypothetical protein
MLPNGKTCDIAKVWNDEGCGFWAVLNVPPKSCGLPTSGALDSATCEAICGSPRQCSIGERRDHQDPSSVLRLQLEGRRPPEGGYSVDCISVCVGRRPSSGADEAPPARGSDPLYEHLDGARRLERRSVDAFHELASDLQRWGAPGALVQACIHAAEEERRHARAMSALMRARGMRPGRSRGRRPRGFASLLALATHNEREGVVGETWGALVAMHQAVHAASGDVRRAMRTVAREEASHAALSFEIARWARARLGRRVAARLDEERRRAFRALRASVASGDANEVMAALGLPAPRAASAMSTVLAPLLDGDHL